MKVIEGLKYAKGHEWVRMEGNRAYIGITDFAQDELGDIVFIELPEVGTDVEVDDILGSIESVKAASDIYAPVSGTVVEVNEELEGSPELVNEEPYESWIAIIEVNDTGELDDLMDADEYEKYCEEEA
ncbi:MAG: glycine cleavage system protein GcvH [Caldicoprobacterales bacterium]|nr:glycine cleavage system protein GcvH [Clostridiales bacterium]